MHFLLHEVWLESTLCQFWFLLEAESGKMIVDGLGSCFYVLSGLKDESAIINIKEIIDVEGGIF